VARYKTVRVILDRAPSSLVRMRIAARIAAACGAKLAALFAQSGPLDYQLPGAGGRVNALITDNVVRSVTESAQRAAQEFERLAGELKLETSWESARDDALESARIAARYSDLLVIGQHRKGSEQDSGMASDFCEELILSAGRPVLVVPEEGEFASVGKRVLVAWNESREATRAVADALPLLARADAVEVDVYETGQPSPEAAETSENLARYLAGHGARATVARHELRQHDLRAQILARATEIRADLIVMGAFGHSRLREMVFGGVTRSVLESTNFPVLLSH
jgi:nucleotide-binding universal stress UspA family protein